MDLKLRCFDTNQRVTVHVDPAADLCTVYDAVGAALDVPPGALDLRLRGDTIKMTADKSLCDTDVTAEDELVVSCTEAYFARQKLERQSLDPSSEKLFAEAAWRRNMKQVVLFTQTGMAPVTTKVMTAAVEGGDAELVEFLARQCGEKVLTDGVSVACGDGPVPLVAVLLEAGGKAGPGDLEVATSNGHVEVARYLISKGVPPSARAVTAAARGGFEEFALLLLDKGAPCPGSEGIRSAAAYGCLTLLQRLVNQSPDSLQCDPSPLLAARTPECLRILVDAGCHPDKLRTSPVATAAASNRVEVMKELITKYSCSPNGLKGDEPPIVAAARHGHPEAVLQLLDLRAEADACFEGRTALYWAACKGMPDIGLRLLASGCCSRECEATRRAPLHWACKLPSPSLTAALLAEKVPVDDPDMLNDTPLRNALASQSEECVRQLLEAGADPNRCLEGKERPLAFAAAHKFVQGVQLLLAAGAEADFGDDVLRRCVPSTACLQALLAAGARPTGTALHHAVIHDAGNAVELLLGAGAPHSVPAGPQGQTALHAAAVTDNATLAQRLLQAGASVSAEDSEGKTPLHIACRTGERVADLLLRAGAPLEACDHRGRTPLHHAAAWGDAALRLLLDKGANPAAQCRAGRTPLSMAAGRGMLPAVVVLLQLPGVDIACARGRTPAFWAVNHEALPVVASFTEGFCTPDTGGVTPLHLAAGQKKIDVLRHLLSQGVPVNPCDAAQATPLHYAARKGKIKHVLLLLEAGASPFSTDSSGKSPRDIAIENGFKDLATYL